MVSYIPKRWGGGAGVRRWRGWGRWLKIGRWRFGFKRVPLEIFIDIIIPIALWPWGRLSL